MCAVCIADSSTYFTGSGKSKKLAKRQAAHKMWEKLQDSPVEHNNMRMGYNEEDDEVCGTISFIFLNSFSISMPVFMQPVLLRFGTCQLVTVFVRALKQKILEEKL